MGQKPAKLSAEELEELLIVCNFTQEELYRLDAAFQELDTEHVGSITTEQFMRFPQLQYNPFLRRILDVCGVRASSCISFKQFVQCISVLGENAPKDLKLRFAFRLYDVDGDNFVSAADFEAMLKMVVGEQLGNEKVKEIARKAIEELDVDNDGKLSYSEFTKAAVSSEMFQKLSIQI